MVYAPFCYECYCVPQSPSIFINTPSIVYTTSSIRHPLGVYRYDYVHYCTDVSYFPRPRFASEFGFQSYPSFNAMAKISTPSVSVSLLPPSSCIPWNVPFSLPLSMTFLSLWHSFFASFSTHNPFIDFVILSSFPHHTYLFFFPGLGQWFSLHEASSTSSTWKWGDSLSHEPLFPHAKQVSPSWICHIAHTYTKKRYHR